MSKTKIKMRCMTCGKWFQSANAKEVTCPDCTQKARKEKQAQKNAPTTTTKTGASSPATTAQVRPSPAPKPKVQAGGTIQWLDKVADVKIAQPEPPAAKPKPSSPSPVQRETTSNTGGNRNNGNGSEQAERGAAASRDRGGNGTTGAPSTIGQRPQPRQPMGGPAGATGATGRPWHKGEASGGAKPRSKPKARLSPPPKPKKEKTPPPAPFVPTAEQIKQVEERYTALAQPTEFDGIRTQIAKELSIPKKAVKKIIKDFRNQEHIPSWWELQTYKGSNEELEKIKAVYQPYLPVPPVGVHKIIAETLDFKPGIVYQAIKAIRQEMELPQYNDPNLHEEELGQRTAEKQALEDQQQSERKAGLGEKEMEDAAQLSTTQVVVESESDGELITPSEQQKAQDAKEDVSTLE